MLCMLLLMDVDVVTADVMFMVVSFLSLLLMMMMIVLLIL